MIKCPLLRSIARCVRSAISFAVAGSSRSFAFARGRQPPALLIVEIAAESPPLTACRRSGQQPSIG
jgi:hypothetical protein